MSDDNKRVLALMPHPDDTEILCAGTLIRLRDLGYEVYIATMTPGDEGSAEMDADVIANIRREEARKGAEAIGAAGYCCLEFRDCEIVFDNPTRHTVTRHVREVAPFLVITTPPYDYMTDHEMTSRLARDACFNISLRNYPNDAPPSTVQPIPYLYYTDPLSGRDIFGDTVPAMTLVDVSAVMDRKVEALKCHDSQRSWLLKQQGMDNYVESMKAFCARRGSQIGASYAEAFRQHLGQAYPQDDVLASLLGQDF